MLGLSQEDVAGRLGITFQQVQKYEKGANGRVRAGCSNCRIASASPSPISLKGWKAVQQSEKKRSVREDRAWWPVVGAGITRNGKGLQPDQ